jgi:acyl carrier protein
VEITLREKIIALIEECLMVSPGTISEETLIEEIEEWDSLAQVLIIGELDEKMGISISLEDAVEISSVKDLFEKTGV